MSSVFDESKIFSRDLSIWDGFLLDRGDQNYVTDPLDFFTAASLGETVVVKNFLERRTVKPNGKNQSGWSGIMYAAYMGHYDTVEVLMMHGADANMKNPRGYTSLILASMCGCDKVIKLLAKHQVDIDAVDKHGWSALFHAASAGHQKATELLLQYGANVEIKEPTQGLTPLMEAAASGHELVVQLLLKKGACVTTKDKTGDDATSLALEYGHVKIAQMIEQHKKLWNKQMDGGSKSTTAAVAARKAATATTVNKCNLSGGPSIHAGPKAFAQMTGLGSDGKPHPHNAIPVFLQENQQPNVDYLQTQAKWNGPKNLESLLKSIDCSKYSHVFQQQGVDLHVFLTLTEADLKEIGISLFGPRRKMVSAIGRAISEIQGVVVVGNENELSYADAINAKLHNLQDRINKMEAEKQELKSMLSQERQLRTVTEGVLMEHKDLISQLRATSDKLESRHLHFARVIDEARSHALSSHFSDKMHMGGGGQQQQNPNNFRYSNVAMKEKTAVIPAGALHELQVLSQSTGECLCKMREVFEKASSTVQVVSKPPGLPAPVDISTAAAALPSPPPPLPSNHALKRRDLN